MYSACLYCNAGLGVNDLVEHFPVGRRLAFDPGRGRLWVVCVGCGRWNLSPIEERHEAIEECERMFRGTYVRVSTGNIGLAKMREGLELVRIGKPLRPEFAAWRYASEFMSRRTRAQVAGGVTVAAGSAAAIALGIMLGPTALAAGATSLVCVPGLTTLMVALPVSAVAIAEDRFRFERVVARVRRADGRLATVRAKHLQSIYLRMDRGDEASLNVQHDDGRLELAGTRAMQTTGVLLANSNRSGADKRAVAKAVGQIEAEGTAEGFLAAASRRNGWRGMRPASVLNRYRGLGAMNLTFTERLALEMSVHEETERRAMHGELAVLHDAEEIARIVDIELTS